MARGCEHWEPGRKQASLGRSPMVRVAGYSDYFNVMTAQLQNEIIARTENDDL